MKIPPRAWLCWLVLLLAGCGEEKLPEMPPRPVLHGIRGEIRLGGEGIAGELQVIRTDLGLMIYDGETESDGSYSIPLPDGRYVIEAEIRAGSIHSPSFAYAASGPTDDHWADTLIVSSEAPPVVADFDFAKVRFRASLPGPDDWFSFRVIGYKRMPDGSWDAAVSQRVTAEFSPVDFTLLPVPPGDYVFRLEVSEGHEAFFLPRTARPEDAEVYSIGPIEAGPIEADLDLYARVLRGRLDGSWRRLRRSAADIFAYNEDSLVIARATLQPDEDIPFTLASCLSESLKLMLRISPAEFWVGGLDYAHATEFVLTAGDTLDVGRIEETGFDLRLDAPLEWLNESVAYMLIDERGVRVEGALSPGYEQDRFVLPGLVPGRYRVGLRPRYLGSAPWVDVWYDNAGRPEEATVLELRAGDPYREIVLRPSTGGVIRVEVGFPEGEEYLRAQLTRADDPQRLHTQWVVSADPVFEFPGLPDGDYKVGAANYWDDDWHVPGEEQRLVWYDRAATWAEATVIEVRDHETIEIRVEP